MTSNQRVLLHLSLIRALSPAYVHVLLDACKNKRVALANLYDYGVSELCDLGLDAAGAQQIVSGLAQFDVLELELRAIEHEHVRVICFDDPEYPNYLRELDEPPLLLYLRGADIAACERNLAVVGSRNGNAYGRAFVERIVPELAARSWVIVSGGARGIDAMAHEAALACGAKTVVVLGSGLCCMYPQVNRALFERIIACGGSVISPFYMRAQPEPWRFPVRNGVIAGMSRGVVVVQAARKSGALNTAARALSYGREVFAVPGQFHDEFAYGCHALIKQGAVLTTSAQDIFDELEPQSRTFSTRVAVSEGQVLTVRERVIQACRDGIGMDDLVRIVQAPQEHIYQELFSLQVDGVVVQDFTGLFRVRSF